MKKHILLFLFFPLFSNAQFYLGINFSGSLQTNGRSLQEFLLIDATVNQATFENLITEKKASFGGGLWISPILGYQMNKYIGIELQAGRSKTNKVSSIITYTNPSDNKVKISMNGNVVSIKPCLVGYIYTSNPLIYTKVGVVYSNCEFEINEDFQKQNRQVSLLINGGKSLGVTFGIGADWHLKKRFYIRTEWTYLNANYFPEKGTITKYNEEGFDQLPDMTDEQKNIHYVRKGNVELTYLGAGLDPGTHLSPQIPISSMGINLSLIYKFIQKHNK